MTPEQINSAIAKACGWTRVGPGDDGTLYGRHPDDYKGYVTYEQIPNYHGSLDAMHEAEIEAIYPAGKALVYFDYLKDIANTQKPVHIERRCTRFQLYSTTATAAQRAEAFLKTLNLWIP